MEMTNQENAIMVQDIEKPFSKGTTDETQILYDNTFFEAFKKADILYCSKKRALTPFGFIHILV
jgi:hypothetical protein